MASSSTTLSSTVSTTTSTTKTIATAAKSVVSTTSSTPTPPPAPAPPTWIYSNSLPTNVKAAYVVSYLLLSFLCLAIVLVTGRAIYQYLQQPRGIKDANLVGDQSVTKGPEDVEVGNNSAPEIEPAK